MADATPWLALAERMPALVEHQFQAYRRLVHWQPGAEDGPREVTAWENARKAALSHLQALIRVHDLIAGQLGPKKHAAGDDDGLASLLAAVQGELADSSDDDAEFDD